MKEMNEATLSLALTKILHNQKEILGRLKIIEPLLNQIVPRRRNYQSVIPSDLMVTSEAAKYLNMGNSQFNKKAKDGIIPHIYIEGEIGRRFSKKALDLWITNRN